MSKTKLSILTALLGVVVIAGSLIGIYLWASTPSPYPPEKVMTYNCENEDQKPTELLEFCADGNGGIAKIKWKSWNSDGASGTGVYFRNNCEPDCASGKFSYKNVAVYLDSPVVDYGKLYLTSLTYEEIGKSGAPVDGGISGGWDLSEMYRTMHA